MSRLFHFMRWLGRVLPPGIVVTAAVAGYLAPTILRAGYQARRGLPLDRADEEEMIQRIILFIACLAYGLYHAVGPNPLFRKEYRGWLAMTPWRAGWPLPLSPLLFATQDLIWLTLLIVLTGFNHAAVNPLVPIVLFMLGYSLPIAAMCLMTGVKPLHYALLFWSGLLLAMWDTPRLAAAFAVALYLLAAWGVHQSLRKFPWDLQTLEGELGKVVKSFQNKPRAVTTAADLEVPWPYNRLAPQVSFWRIGAFDAVMVGLLLGWWVFAIQSRMDWRGPSILMTVLTVLFIPVMRLAYYTRGHSSPINLAGRLLTGRLIIPAYDVVILGPVVAGACGLGIAWYMGVEWDMPQLALPLAIAMSAGLSLGMPPERDEWQLTAPVRLTPAAAKTTDAAPL